MSAAFPRTAVAALAALLVLVLPAVGAAQTPPGAGTPNPAATSLSRCLQTTSSLSVLFMIDESKSLRGTDRLGQRVDGVKAALAGFARLAETPAGGRTTPISVLLAGFSGRVVPDPDAADETDDPAHQWTTLDADTLDRILVEAESFRERDSGRDTDYALALRAARLLLADRAVEQTRGGGPPPCKAIVWFTDGRYTIKDRLGGSDGLPDSAPYAPAVDLAARGGGARGVAAGRRFLCRPGGLMDGLVSDGVTTFTVALSGRMDRPDRAFLEALSTGRGGSAECGSQLSPRTGSYLPVERVDCLFFRFGSLLESGACPVPTTTVCPDRPCSRGSTAFRTVEGLDRFLIRATTGGDAIELELDGPRGGSARLAPGDSSPFELDGATLTPRWVSDRAVEIEAELSDESAEWVGAWSFAFVDPGGDEPDAVPIATVQLFTDLEPMLRGDPVAVRGRTSPIAIALTGGDGEPVRSGPLVDAARIVARTTDGAAGETRPVDVAPADDEGTRRASLPVARSSTASFVFLDVVVEFPVDRGVAIAPQRRSFRLPVELPEDEGFPSLAPSELNLPSIAGDGETHGTLVVTGSRDGPGCVWIEQPRVEGPGGAGAVRASASAPTAAASCLRVAPGQRREIDVAFATAEGAADAVGTVRGTIDVHLRSELADDTQTVRTEASFELYRERDIGTRLAMLVGLLALGVAAPVGLLYGMNAAGARFSPPQQVRMWSGDLVVRPGVDARLSGGDLPQPSYDEFSPLSVTGADRGERSLTIDAGGRQISLRAVPLRAPVDLFNGPRGVASAGDQGLVAGAQRPLHRWDGGRSHELPLSLAGSWLFVPQAVARVDGGSGDEVETVEGRLVLLIAEGGSIDQGERLGPEAAAALAKLDWDWLLEHAGDGAANGDALGGDDGPGGGDGRPGADDLPIVGGDQDLPDTDDHSSRDDDDDGGIRL